MEWVMNWALERFKAAGWWALQEEISQHQTMASTCLFLKNTGRRCSISRGLPFAVSEYRRVVVRWNGFQEYSRKAFFIRGYPNRREENVLAQLVARDGRVCLQFSAESFVALENNVDFPNAKGQLLAPNSAGEVRKAFSLGKADAHGIFTLVEENSQSLSRILLYIPERTMEWWKSTILALSLHSEAKY